MVLRRRRRHFGWSHAPNRPADLRPSIVPNHERCEHTRHVARARQRGLKHVRKPERRPCVGTWRFEVGVTVSEAHVPTVGPTVHVKGHGDRHKWMVVDERSDLVAVPHFLFWLCRVHQRNALIERETMGVEANAVRCRSLGDEADAEMVNAGALSYNLVAVVQRVRRHEGEAGVVVRHALHPSARLPERPQLLEGKVPAVSVLLARQRPAVRRHVEVAGDHEGKHSRHQLPWQLRKRGADEAAQRQPEVPCPERVCHEQVIVPRRDDAAARDDLREEAAVLGGRFGARGRDAGVRRFGRLLLNFLSQRPQVTLHRGNVSETLPRLQ
mmetsp:Transcript_826/g.2855  ORF Transcript_826/g.2855 Transcript_826/m.2855 type:complete len:326 (+) Transcript_826:111-1088(+)